jgi:hypothetical protein
MSDNSKKLPHISLKLTTKGTFNSGGGRSKKNTQTSINKGNRQGHGNKIKNSASSIVAEWHSYQEERKKENKPPLPEVLPLVLEIDPETFDLDDLRTSGIEIISELENGFIIAASADTNLTELQQKIEKFFQEQQGGGVVAKILDIRELRQRPEFILSPALLEKWNEIRDGQIYTVDVGISCLGIKSKLISEYPKEPNQKDYKSVDDYSKAVENYGKKINKWIEKRNITWEEWDDFALERKEDLTKFVEQDYQGKIYKMDDGEKPRFSEAPDSFSCRISISGKGLKDLVYNFPYVFEVTEPDNIQFNISETSDQNNQSTFELQSPHNDAPKICVIDSGIQEHHPLLANAIDTNYSKSWVIRDEKITADSVSNGGHGTRVAGAILYPREIPKEGKEKAICWIQNARILDSNGRLSDKLYPPTVLEDIVEIYHQQAKTRIFNHSITGDVPCWTRYMSTWAETIDLLIWKNDILFIVAAGNIPLDDHRMSSRLSIKVHQNSGRQYPDYLLEDSCRVANPAQSFQALTVGSVTQNFYQDSSWISIGEKDNPSPFSCSGLGIWETIKPEVVEYGGDLVKDYNNPLIIKCSPSSPELIRSTLNRNAAPLVDNDDFGTSYAAPKVSHIAASLAAEFPDESCLLYRALIVQSARWPQWARDADNQEKEKIIRQIGYGIPNLERAISNTDYRITLITKGETRIRAKDAHIYQVQLPETLISQGDDFDYLVEITLSYKAQPRRTRRHKRKYLSTWLDWECSKRGENAESFKQRVLKEYESTDEVEEGTDLFIWTLGKQKNNKTLKNVSRSNGTIQKDWAVVKSYNLREAFCIAVVAHEGWNNDPFAEVPYYLVVSFEALDQDIPVYTSVAQAQVKVELEVEEEVET